MAFIPIIPKEGISSEIKKKYIREQDIQPPTNRCCTADAIY